MSLKVELTDLPTTAAKYGPGFLLSGDASGGPHAMHVRYEFGGLGTAGGGSSDVKATCDVGKTAARNIEANPLVTLLWPPQEDGGYSLIADGSAIVDEGIATIKVLGAVLHRHA